MNQKTIVAITNNSAPSLTLSIMLTLPLLSEKKFPDMIGYLRKFSFFFPSKFFPTLAILFLCDNHYYSMDKMD